VVSAELRKNIGTVATRFVTFAPQEGIGLECGERLSSVTLAYETYGELDAGKTNAVLITHALSGDAHAAGYHKGTRKPGWWDDMIGPGKAFDTDKYFVICSNVLGGCTGSTGPSSINPRTQKPYALEFPLVSVNDMVNCQTLLVDHLGIDKLLCVAGVPWAACRCWPGFSINRTAFAALYPFRPRSSIHPADRLQ